MTQPDAAASEVPDFTIKREPHSFVIDDDTFYAPAILSPVTLKKMAAQVGQIGDVANLSDIDSILKAIDALGAVMRALMPGASGKLFEERLRSEGEEGQPAPIDLMAQAIPAFYFLLERYGLRPTVPSSNFSAGSTDGHTSTPSEDISSTAGASPLASDSTTSS